MKKLIVLTLLMSLFFTSPMLHAKICFRGKPAPYCKTFFLTEVGATVAGLSWELGGMYNLNKRSALGATFLVSIREYGDYAAGFKFRYRHWLDSFNGFSIDISPGLVLWTQRKDPRFRNYPIFTGHVGFNYKDMVTLMVQAYVRRSRLQKNKVGFALGLKFGSYSGIVLGVASIITAIVLASVGEL